MVSYHAEPCPTSADSIVPLQLGYFPHDSKHFVPTFMDIWRGLLGVIYVAKVATGLSGGFQPGFNLGNPQRNEFALKARG